MSQVGSFHVLQIETSVAVSFDCQGAFKMFCNFANEIARAMTL